MRFPNLPYVDFAIGTVRARNNVVHIREALEARNSTAQENSFITVYRFPEEYVHHVASAGTVRGYTGVCYADFLPFDVDRAGNLAAALAAARAIAFTLLERYDVREDQIRYFFSGAKGFHLLIPTQLFGDVRPAANLPAVWKGMALAIAGDAGEEIDRVIYDQNRLFRLPDTKHPSGLWKVELTWDEFSRWTTDQVRFAARTPRNLELRPHDLEPVDRLVELFAKQADAAESAPRGSGLLADGTGHASDLARALQPVFVRGQRHDVIVSFAGYAAKRHLPRETTHGVAEILLDGAPGVEDPGNLPKAIDSTYDRIRRGEQVKGFLELKRYFESLGGDWEIYLRQLQDLLGDKPKAAPEPEPAREESDALEFDVILGEVLDRFAEEKRQPIDATPTPWDAWSKICRGAGGAAGLARGWHVIVGARSGNGKSLLGANIAAKAIEHGERVAIVSLEMSQIEMATRVLAIVGKQAVNDLEHGQYFRLEAWNEAHRAMHRTYERTGGRVLINRHPMNKLSDLATAMRRLHEFHGVRFFVVDYLQLAAIGGGRASELLDRITEVSFVVRGLAKQLHVTTVGMSQLNRESSKTKETPRKEGLMGGSPLENDAEQVLLLDHSRIERPHGATGDIYSWAILDKNRHGPVGEIPTRLSTRTLEMWERNASEILESEHAA